MLARYPITDDEYNRIKPLLLEQIGKLKRNAQNNSFFIDAVLWIASIGTYSQIYQSALESIILFINYSVIGLKKAHENLFLYKFKTLI